ncbi:hypothetical protein DQ04_09541040 [Trypanosoma grayi]|uniref:hypothetical protein n=1 Tax=Trypanosoma grayi TaxID=71804 RepID=UPI0004F409F4|nr:hypothetical protein DQ04_09541040 [Trypanosoma grayi]KEG07527.1 hypothetical protein DQ04_09541040 [Trypanosoma grayi]
MHVWRSFAQAGWATNAMHISSSRDSIASTLSVGISWAAAAAAAGFEASGTTYSVSIVTVAIISFHIATLNVIVSDDLRFSRVVAAWPSSDDVLRMISR